MKSSPRSDAELNIPASPTEEKKCEEIQFHSTQRQSPLNMVRSIGLASHRKPNWQLDYQGEDHTLRNDDVKEKLAVAGVSVEFRGVIDLRELSLRRQFENDNEWIYAKEHFGPFPKTSDIHKIDRERQEGKETHHRHDVHHVIARATSDQHTAHHRVLNAHRLVPRQDAERRFRDDCPLVEFQLPIDFAILEKEPAIASTLTEAEGYC
mmetsp:Transcript_5924/g.16701  ORF Transcript_5924/g.16701 Transcript_5924/m.16701 type:complete len:208 (-) Transcript_5924:1226-1849(-)